MDLRSLMFRVGFDGNETAVKKMDGATNKLKKTAEGAVKKLDAVNKKFTEVGKGMTARITAPVVAMVGASINEYAKLEQSIGGVETLFKDSASSVIKNSETAYKRAGVSANSYMESITSFSASLLQGLGGDTEAAVKIADMAMVDMSDNANKFGTDIGSIQNTYQGLAKSNFTMLDNLKLGFGGTAGEMARLINQTGVMGKGFKATAENVKDVPFDMMIKAINKVQTEMGVTGTTSKEAMETVAGSIGMAKASLQDFLGGLGNSKADVGQLTSNMVESFGAVVTNIKGVLATIWDNIPMEGWQKQLIAFAVVAGPAILVIGKIAGAISLVITVGAKLASGIGLVIGVAGKIIFAFQAVAGGAATVAEGMALIMSPVGWVITGLIALVATGKFVIGAFRRGKEETGTIMGGIVNIFTEAVDGIKSLWNGLTEFLKNPIKGTVDFVGKGIDKFFGKDKVDGSHKTGKSRIPYDGYVAETHKDEAILNKGEAEEWRRGTRKVGNDVVYSPSISITVGQDVGTETKRDLEKTIKNILEREREKFFYKLALQNS